MLLSRTRSGRAALGCATTLALLWPGLALAQAQVEAVPEPPPAFDMWDLEEILPHGIQLPVDSAPNALVPGPVETGQPQALDARTSPPLAGDATDPCRHFTQEERRLLPSLCGASD